MEEHTFRDFNDPETGELLGKLLTFPNHSRHAPPPMLVSSRETEGLLRQLEKAARTDLTVLLQSESGTGKEHLAACLHYFGKRSLGPLVDVNCACLPKELVETELFGHERGAFTSSAGPKAGLFESAQRGTLYLDEISEFPHELQAKLLRALQERVIRRVGGLKNIPVDVRLVVSTNRNLADLIGENKFREDLFYRLNVLAFSIRPLRERPDEILPLARYFALENHTGLEPKPFSDRAKQVLLSYHWPGNIRELQNTVFAALFRSEEREITARDLAIGAAPSLNGNHLPRLAGRNATLAEVEREHILDVLNRHDWNLAQAAAVLGVYRPTLYSKLEKHGIKRPEEDENTTPLTT